ncbi:MAG: metal ABC transporter ATP-binding protein [Abditibacteriota bacterium]|nr:metal ABC transporter ATP-binding protein [Abditibacteriota bacterium]
MTPALEIKNVSFKRNGAYVLKDIDFTLKTGDYATIIGPNGGGKTTFIKLICGLLKPCEGSIKVFGDDPGIRKVCYVPQTKDIDRTMPFKVMDVILMGRKLGLFARTDPADKEIAVKAAGDAGVREFLDRQMKDLSGGEQQRVLIARALATGGELLLLDEPITGIDPGGTAAIHRILEDLKHKGKTIVYVSHDLGLISEVTDTVACINVRLFAHGSPSEVITGENLKKLFGTGMAYLYHRLGYTLVGEHTHSAGGLD